MPAQIDLTYTGNLRYTLPPCFHRPKPGDRCLQGSGRAGQNLSATDLVVVGLGTCILTTLAIVGQRHQLDLTGMSACMEKEMVAGPRSPYWFDWHDDYPSVGVASFPR